MTRTSVLLAALVYVIGVGPAAAQSLRDIVKDSEGGRMPSQGEWQERSAPAPAEAPEPPAAAPMPPSASGEPTKAAPAICVPPGMPPLNDLVAVGFGVMVAPVEGTEQIVAVNAIGLVVKDKLARYRAGEASLDFIVYYVHGQLAAVDDHPGDPSQPDLVDTGMVSPRGTALEHGTPLCQWERLTGTPEPREGKAEPGSRI